MNAYDQNQNQIPSQPDAVRPVRRGSRAALYTSIGAAGLGAAGLVTALVVGLGAPSTAHSATTPDHGATTSQVNPTVVYVPVPSDNGAQGGSTGGGSSTPSVQPSATVRLLQEQLGQLNYYEGAVNGISSPQLHQAIEYLQRDAHLPQTGVLTPATQSALNRMLATGNNQMGGS